MDRSLMETATTKAYSQSKNESYGKRRCQRTLQFATD